MTKKLIFIGIFMIFGTTGYYSFFLDYFPFQLKNNFLQTFHDQTPRNFVVLSSTLKLRYLFVLPFTVASWKRLNVTSIVILIGDETAFRANNQALVTLKVLEQLEAKIIFLKAEKVSSTSLSQIVRLFGAVLPINEELPPDNTVFITSDADLIVFHLENHVPNIKNGTKLHLYNSKCCGPVKVPPSRGNEKITMYPMGTIGATLTTWRNIMGFNASQYSTPVIEAYIINEFGPNFFHPNDDANPRLVGSSIWYADQSLISYKLDRWLKDPSNRQATSEQQKPPKRIDRIRWPKTQRFKSMKLNFFDDCHQPTAAYIDKEWKTFKPFLEFAFRDNESLLKDFFEYREKFVGNKN